MAWTVVIMVFLAGLAEGLMDWLQFRLQVSPAHWIYNNHFWTPARSWMNKWEWGEDRYVVGEKFWMSSTLFVFMTDGWHLMKFLRNLFLFSALLLIAICDMTVSETIISVVISRIMFGFGFSLSFNHFCRLKHRVQEHIRPGLCPFGKNLLGLVMADTIDAGAHDHGRS